MRKLVPIFFIILFLTQVALVFCEQALIISWDGSNLRANNTFVRMEGRDTYTYDGRVEDIADKGRIFTYEEIDGMVKSKKYDTVFFIYYDGYRSFKLQGSPDDLPDILDDVEIAAKRYGYIWDPPVKKETAQREIVVTYDPKKESIVTAKNSDTTSTVSAYSYSESQDASGSVIFLFGLIILGVIAYAINKSFQNNNSAFTSTQQVHYPIDMIPDPMAVKRIELGLELNCIMESFMKEDISENDHFGSFEDGQEEFQYSNETMPRFELIPLVTTYLKIRGINPDIVELNDILDETIPVSENISIAAAYYDSGSREFIIENLTDEEVNLLLNLCTRYYGNEREAVKTIHYLIFGEPFEINTSP